MSDAHVTVHAHPPERRRRSTVLTCGGTCCCCCCCLHSVGALVGAAVAAVPAAAVAPGRSASVLGWFWGSVGACLLVTPFVCGTYWAATQSSSGADPVSAFVTGALVGWLVALVGAFPVITLLGGGIAAIGVSASGGRDRGRVVLGVAVLTGASLLGAVLGGAIMAGAVVLLSR